MKIPNAKNAIVSNEKTQKYLLDVSHQAGKFKAYFFISFGFSLNKHLLLQNALKEHCKINNIVGKIKTDFGEKYIIEGIINSPDKRNPLIRSIWIIEKNTQNPILVTAYPLK